MMMLPCSQVPYFLKFCGSSGIGNGFIAESAAQLVGLGEALWVALSKCMDIQHMQLVTWVVQFEKQQGRHPK